MFAIYYAQQKEPKIYTNSCSSSQGKAPSPVLLPCALLIFSIYRRRNQGGTGGMCPPKFHKLLYKLLTTLYVVSNCAPKAKSLSYTTVKFLPILACLPQVEPSLIVCSLLHHSLSSLSCDGFGALLEVFRAANQL